LIQQFPHFPRRATGPGNILPRQLCVPGIGRTIEAAGGGRWWRQHLKLEALQGVVRNVLR
jgi:hypothetical protein